MTLEHLLHAMTRDRVASEVLLACGADLGKLQKEIEDYLDRSLEAQPTGGEPEQTGAFQRVLQRAAWHVQGSGRSELHAGDVLVALTRERGSQAVFFLDRQGVKRLDILSYLSHGISKEGEGEEGEGGEQGDEQAPRTVKDPFKAFTVNLVERAAQGLIDPLIGREAEIEEHPGAVPAAQEQPHPGRRTGGRQDRDCPGAGTAHPRRRAWSSLPERSSTWWPTPFTIP